jgi:hypothetical protein
MSAQPDFRSARFAGFENLLAQSFAIARRIAWPRRSMRALLPVGQIVANNAQSGLLEGIRDGDEQR